MRTSQLVCRADPGASRRSAGDPPGTALRILGVAATALLAGLLTATPAGSALPAPGAALRFAGELAAAEAQVTASPSTVSPGQSTTVTAGCGTDATAATLSAASFDGSSQIGMVAAPSSAGPGAFTADVTVPETTQPGSYDLRVWCSTGESGMGTLVVAPNGAPSTGDGSTSRGANRAMLAGGALLIAVAAAGLVLIRRRSDAP